MAAPERVAFIRNIAEVPWREFPNHFGGALAKPLARPARTISTTALDVPADGHVALQAPGAGAGLSRTGRRGLMDRG